MSSFVNESANALEIEPIEFLDFSYENNKL
jgi:hypothetical protein